MSTQNNDQQIQKASQGIQELAQFIPGGLFRCLWDEPLTLVEMSEGFLRLIGYTREEIREVYHDSFRKMIDPRDWEPVLAEVLRQTAIGPEKELEYRMRRKDGTTIWVLDKGNLVQSADGVPSFYCLLVDITGMKRMQEELRLSLERLQIIMDQTNDIIVEWDLRKDTFTYSSNWIKKFGYEPLKRNVSRDLESSSNIHRDDIHHFSQMLAELRSGQPYVETEARLKRTDDSYLWCRIRFTAQHGETGQPIKAVGVIVDIDEEKKRSQELMNLAQRDALTGLYNKGAVQEQIVQALKANSDGGCSALMIIDVDNFKTVNDTMGHLFGDEFLVGISRELSRLFREQDTVGRIGGDEFIAFMRRLPDGSVAEQRAKKILDIFKRESESAGLPETVSCSIGISIAPQHGVDFQTLFRRADLSLYHAKRHGKNCCRLYDDSCTAQGFPVSFGRELPTSVGSKIDSDERDDSGGYSLADQVFRILYSDARLEKSIPAILELVGRRFDVSRAYIFENSEDGRFFCNTFEWCGSGVRPEIDNLRRVPYEVLMNDGFYKNYDMDGVFYCRDISTLPPAQYDILHRQGIRSLLHCAIFDGGAFQGLVGFDECRSNRYWVQEQIDALSLVSRIVGTYLLKQRAKERDERTAREMSSLLECQNAWIYVIRPETYEMLYVNQKTLEMIPNVSLGARCYADCFGRAAPCERCPARAVQEGAANCSMRVYNPLFKLWFLADASRIDWYGEQAVLLTCRDITDLMPAQEE